MKRRAASVVTTVQSFPNNKVGASDTFVTTPSTRHTLSRDALGQG